MFAYCGNNPVNGVDPCGTCLHRLDFWNDCENCVTDEFGVTITRGKYISINFWVLNVTASIDVAADAQGNVQPLLSFSKDLNATGKFSASFGDTYGLYFVPDTSYLYKSKCDTYDVGGSVNVPIPYTPIAVGGGGNIVMNTDRDFGVVFTRGISTASASGGEWHFGIIDTYPLLPQFNIPSAVEYIANLLKSIFR